MQAQLDAHIKEQEDSQPIAVRLSKARAAAIRCASQAEEAVAEQVALQAKLDAATVTAAAAIAEHEAAQKQVAHLAAEHRKAEEAAAAAAAAAAVAAAAATAAANPAAASQPGGAAPAAAAAPTVTSQLHKDAIESLRILAELRRILQEDAEAAADDDPNATPVGSVTSRIRALLRVPADRDTPMGTGEEPQESPPKTRRLDERQ